MPAKKFRFVSPGVQIKEIDKSQLPALPEAIGPVVIGRSLKGPTMVPVTVNNYEEFVQKFGEPDPGLGSPDVWRNGNNTGPTYGAYAAQAWLANSTPLTFLRLGGVEALDVGTGGKAGWETDKTALSSNTGSNGGAFGLFLMPDGVSGSGFVAVTGTLAAIFYLDEGSIQLEGTTPDGLPVGSDTNNGAGVFVDCGTNLSFKATIKNASETKKETVSFNFTKGSQKFIRKVFNTNPTLTNDAVTPSESLKTYWLGETFEDFLEELNIDTDAGAGTVHAFIAGLQAGSSNSLANFRRDAEAAKTGWVISQHLNPNTASFDPATDTTKLFRFVAGEGLGSDWEQNNYKISIFDVKPPLNDYQKYGTFSVGIRNMEDSDQSPEWVEVFSNLSLDPNSPNYIASRIGDRRVEWREVDGEERYVELGTYANNSKIVRVEMNQVVDRGGVDASALPFGFFGPTRYKTITLNGTDSISGVSTITGSDSVVAIGTSSVPYVTGAAGSGLYVGYDITGSIVFPSLTLLVTASDAGTLSQEQAYFGMKVDRPLNDSIKDLLKIKPAYITDSTLADDADRTEYSFVFTLDDLVKDTEENFKWVKDARKDGISYTASSSLGFEDLLEAGYDKFTMPLIGGFDGLDIKEREPFRNTKLKGATQKVNYAYNSVRRAVLSVKDPEVVEMNLLAVPGITNTGLTNEMIRMCENRADALAIIDLEGGYEPDTEDTNDEYTRRGSVSDTITAVKDRNFNTSYACAYYPWVQMQDSTTGVKLWIPPSIPALGTMASSQENSEIWFAPAGFNRGGLDTGTTGLSITAVRDLLLTKQRDSLYERNINPIAKFQNEGIVIFGQKTLQATPSALDRINVRRLVIFLKKEISRIAAGLLFEPNVQDTWKRFVIPTTRLLEEVKTGLGIADYRVVLDETTTTPEEIDRNMLYAKLFIKPVYAIEFIGIDFVITNTGASFDDL